MNRKVLGVILDSPGTLLFSAKSVRIEGDDRIDSAVRVVIGVLEEGRRWGLSFHL
jgi:hypothetical protein